jgi:hypothetical protein
MKILATFFDAKGKRLGEHVETHEKGMCEVIIPLIMIRKEYPTAVRYVVDIDQTDKTKEETNALDAARIQSEAFSRSKKRGGEKRVAHSKRNPSERRG